MRDPNAKWGDYYLSGSLPHRRKYWPLELVHSANQLIPTFNEIFDEDTFYMFAFFTVIGTILIAMFLSLVIGVRIREHPLHVNRQWRDFRPVDILRPFWHRYLRS
jgi:hypothetical protein